MYISWDSEEVIGEDGNGNEDVSEGYMVRITRVR